MQFPIGASLVVTVSSRFRDIEDKMYLGNDLDLSRSRDVIVHVTIRFVTVVFIVTFTPLRHVIIRLAPCYFL